MGLVALLIDIFSNFFFYLAHNASLDWTDEDERDLPKKVDQPAKYTFSPQSEFPLFQGQNAHTFDSLTADSDDFETRFWVHINQLVKLVPKMVSDLR